MPRPHRPVPYVRGRNERAVLRRLLGPEGRAVLREARELVTYDGVNTQYASALLLWNWFSGGGDAIFRARRYLPTLAAPAAAALPLAPPSTPRLRPRQRRMLILGHGRAGPLMGCMREKLFNKVFPVIGGIYDFELCVKPCSCSALTADEKVPRFACRLAMGH